VGAQSDSEDSKKVAEEDENEENKNDNERKHMLNDVWIYDTLTQ